MTATSKVYIPPPSRPDCEPESDVRQGPHDPTTRAMQAINANRRSIETAVFMSVKRRPMQRSERTGERELDRFAPLRRENLNLEFRQFVKDDKSVKRTVRAEHDKTIVSRGPVALRSSCPFKALSSLGYWITGDCQRTGAPFSR